MKNKPTPSNNVTCPFVAKHSADVIGVVSRLLVLLRVHGLLKKVSGTHRYQLTQSGRVAVTALLTARRASVKQLDQLAA